MAVPSTIVKFRKLQGNVGSFGDVWADIQRPGLDGHTQKYLGKRGKRSQVTGWFFSPDLATATVWRTYLESLQGREVMLTSSLDPSFAWQVFLHNIDAGLPQKIVSTEANVAYRVIVNLDVTRTA